MLPLISVCIPVYNTEPYLLQCLCSVMTQDFADFEVIIVSDASNGRDEKNRTAKKIVRLVQKENKKIPVYYIENRENHGILEVRRTLCSEAHGTYICFVDSDDVLEQGALTAFFSGVTRTQEGYDIIQAKSASGSFDENGNFFPTKKNRYDATLIGEIYNHQIFHEWVSSRRITGILCGKLIRRELLLKAFDNIPYSECNFAEDYLISFFLMQYAQTCLGINSYVYRYRLTSGVSSARKIDSLKKWKMICTTASVFSIISEWLNNHSSEHQIKIEEIDLIRMKTSYYLANNLKQLKETVLPELQPAAHEMLCEYWGEGFVQVVEKQL